MRASGSRTVALEKLITPRVLASEMTGNTNEPPCSEALALSAREEPLGHGLADAAVTNEPPRCVEHRSAADADEAAIATDRARIDDVAERLPSRHRLPVYRPGGLVEVAAREVFTPRADQGSLRLDQAL